MRSRRPAPVISPRSAERHHTRSTTRQRPIRHPDPLHPILLERDPRPHRTHRQPRPRRQRTTLITRAQLHKRPAGPLIQPQLLIPVIPEIDPQIHVLTAILNPDRRTDPLPTTELRPGHLQARILIRPIPLRDPHIPRQHACRPHHLLRGDRQPTITHRHPTRAQTTIRPIKIIRTRRRRRRRRRSTTPPHPSHPPPTPSPTHPTPHTSDQPADSSPTRYTAPHQPPATQT